MKRPSTTARSAPERTRLASARAATQQVQPGDHHGLAGAGFPGQYRQAAVEFGRRDADGAQRLDPYFTKHRAAPSPSTPAGDRQAELAHEAVGERRTIQPRPFHRYVATPHLQPCTGRDEHLAAAVAEHQGVVPVALDFDGDAQRRGW